MDSRASETSVAAFQGEPGAFSELASRQLVGPGPLLPVPALEDVFAAVVGRRSQYGVLPLENTIAGTVPGAYELLISSDLSVVAETRVAIEHVLLAPPGVAFTDVRRVLSHPVALAQCGRFFDRHPGIAPVAAFDTAGAVRIVMQENDGATAAIAGAHAAGVYGAAVLATNLQDHAANWTRFGLLARPGDPRGPGRPTKVLVVFALRHEPGSLAAALGPAAHYGVNLTKIESRSIPSRPFEYRFFVELEGDDAGALERVVAAMTDRTESLRVVGAYDRTHSGAHHGYIGN